jgi:hypothetical protein
MYGRTPTTRTESFDSAGHVISSIETVHLGTGEARLIQQALDQATDPQVKEFMGWLAHAIGATDSMDLDITVVRRWNC